MDLFIIQFPVKTYRTARNQSLGIITCTAAPLVTEVEAIY